MSSNYEPLRNIPLQGGVNVSAPPLSPSSQGTLFESYNVIVSGDGYVRPYSGSTSQGTNSGSDIMLQWGAGYGGIKNVHYLDKTFAAPGAVGASNTLTVTNSTDWVTGLACTVSSTLTLPTGLAALTTYYVIVTGTNTLKLASTLANALLGTAVSITASTGTGTVTIDVSNASVTASGNWMQDIGLSRWGIGAGQPMIAGVAVPGYTLSTNLQVQIPASGAFGVPVQAGLSQPSTPDVGIVSTTGTITGPISAKLERTRPSTGANSVASPNSAVIVPQANKVRVTFPAAETGQEAWRVFFTFQGFGGVGISYLCQYSTYTDIPESVVSAGDYGGVAATGALTVSVNPTAAETLVVNGVTLTFVAGASTATNVHIGATVTDTANNLAAVLAASVNAALTVASYSAASGVVTITYTTNGTAGNAYTLAVSSGGNVTRSGSTLTGGVDGVLRSLEFNYQDGDLLPIEASFDDYPPPAATHAIRLNTVMNVVGCYSDSVTDPTSTSPGTCIAVSKENNYESYVPTALLYLPEPVVDVLARASDDYGYIGCLNSVSALQYIGDRGDGLPPCILTTVLPDIGVQYPHNWCQIRGRLLLYTAKGNLLLMDAQGSFDSSFANPVSKILKGFTTTATSVGYDPKNDSIVVMNTSTILVYSFQADQWRKIFLPDYGITDTLLACTSAAQNLYFTVTNGTNETAYTYDSGSATAPLAIVSNYQNAGGSVLNDLYEMAIAAETDVSTYLAVCIGRNLQQVAFRTVSTTNGVIAVNDVNANWDNVVIGQKVILFGANVGGGGTTFLSTTVAGIPGTTQIELTVAPQATLTNCLLFIGDYVATKAISAADHLPNFFPNLVETRSFSVGCWIKGQNVGNVLTADILGATYSSSRSL